MSPAGSFTAWAPKVSSTISSPPSYSSGPLRNRVQLMSVRTRSPWPPGMKRTALSMWLPKVLVAPA